MSAVKKQSRRTVSISGPRYWAFRDQCIATGNAQSLVIDHLITRWLREQGAPTLAPRPSEDTIRCEATAYFTF